MARSYLALVLVVASLFVAPSPAAAQTTIQGQIIIQEATPSTTTAPPPQAQVYAEPPPTAAPQSAYVSPSGPAQTGGCPVGSVVQMDRYGRPMCMIETTRHRVSGGLLGAGIGILVGGWALEIVSSLVVGVGGVVGCAFGSSRCWGASSDASAFFNWGFVPLIGPWVEMGYLWPNADGGIYAWLAIEGLLQAGGLVMLIFGALGSDVTDYEPAPGYAFHVRPMITASTTGLSAELTF